MPLVRATRGFLLLRHIATARQVTYVNNPTIIRHLRGRILRRRINRKHKQSTTCVRIGPYLNAKRYTPGRLPYAHAQCTRGEVVEKSSGIPSTEPQQKTNTHE